MQRNEIIDLGRIDKHQITRKSQKHVPSRIQPDTLFTFTTELRWLLKSLQYKMLSPRYCEEDISYLKISNIKRIAYPMKCFCDINLHKLVYHMEWYGDYGIAFEKNWGMKKNIQPVHYLNEQANLRKDISETFRSVLQENVENESKSHQKLKNYLLHELMYYKPYQGKFRNRKTGKSAKKCFADECEWRYIPDVSKIDFPFVIAEEDILNAGLLINYSNAMDGNIEVSISFTYSEIKYIILKTPEDLRELIRAIDDWGLGDEKYVLLSKVLIWEQSKGDF